jgi:SAM-dependent methyltransferase
MENKLNIEREFDSNKYWEDRYKNNETSGDGSYGKLAIFKGNIIYNFIKEYDVKSILDLGCGDGNQLKYYNTTNINYIGVDPSSTIINKLKEIYKNDKNKKFIILDKNFNTKAELTLSCDVLFHLINLNIWEKHIDNLFNISTKYVIIYAYDFDQDWNNHCKSRKFTDFIKKKYSNWQLIKVIKNEYPLFEGCDDKNASMSDFYFYKKI